MKPEVLALAKEAWLSRYIFDPPEWHGLEPDLERFYLLAQEAALKEADAVVFVDEVPLNWLADMAAQKRKEAESC